MGDDDRIPVAGRRAGEESLAFFLDEVGVVGDQDACGRIEHQELASDLGEAVIGHCDHWFVGETEPALLHHRGAEAERLARADRVRDIGRAGGDDPPDDTLLVIAHLDGGRRAGQRQDACR